MRVRFVPIARSACLVAAVGGCGGAPGAAAIEPAGEVFNMRVAPFEGLESGHRLVLAPAAEPGRRLVLFGRLTDRDGRPLPGYAIRFFHTDRGGEYGERVPGDESTARLSGTLRSGPGGRFVVSTILPGAYDGAEGGHIHAKIEEADPSTYDVHFSQFIGFGLRRWAEDSQQAVVLDVFARGDTLVTHGDLPVRLARPGSS